MIEKSRSEPELDLGEADDASPAAAKQAGMDDTPIAPGALAKHVRILGRGPGRSRNLEQHEAREAMTAILDGSADPVAVGALLMLMRYRAENAAEIAGFVEAMRDRIPHWRALPVTLDWPSYASGRSRGLPLFLLSAKLLAQAGEKVLVHGWNSNSNPFADVRSHVDEAGIPLATTADEAANALGSHGIAYAPLECIEPEFLRVLKLRDVLGLRSPMNTACRAMNPGGAAVSVQGVFHPPYRELQQDAAALLGEHTSLVIKGGGGEFERHPSKAIAVYGLLNGTVIDEVAQPFLDETRRLADAAPVAGDLGHLWRGERTDDFAEATVIGTAALALHAAGCATDDVAARTLASKLWAQRLG
ncbi:MAG: glycosyl transferase family protein [Pseudomonadota bacterium]